jgi:hypothetical protein
MNKDILKIKKLEDNTTDIEVLENVNVTELYKVMIDTVAIISELMLQDVDDLKYHKFKKQIKDDLVRAVDEDYTN